MKTSAILAGALALGLVGCDGYPQDTEPLAPLDVDIYRDAVAAYVGPGCGTLDCHGVAERPLRIFWEDGLRAADDLRGAPITDAELAATAAAFAGVSPGVLDEHLALVKPLAEAAGGYEHIGGDLWPSTDAAGYACVRAWLLGDDDGAVSACEQAASALP